VLGRYKDRTRTVERGFRFLKDPLFFTGSTFLKRPERVMALALLVYALGEWALRRGLAETGSSLPDQKGKPLPKDPPCAGSSSSSSGCAWWSWRAGPWSSTWPPITRPRCACWGHSDITSWSEGGAECGFVQTEVAKRAAHVTKKGQQGLFPTPYPQAKGQPCSLLWGEALDQTELMHIHNLLQRSPTFPRTQEQIGVG
jgi:hypothetical protein